jgi:hypothetical protein
MFANPNKQYLVGALRVVVDRLTFGLAIATSRSSGQIAVARLIQGISPKHCSNHTNPEYVWGDEGPVNERRETS